MAVILLTLMSLIPIVFNQEITTTDCGINKACHKSPGSCTTSTDCDYLVTWKRKTSDNTIMEFEVSTKKQQGWVALAFNPTNRLMPGSRGEICYLAGGVPMFKGFHSTVRSIPSLLAPATNTVLSSLNVVNGAIICRFSRPVISSGYQNPLGPAVHLIMAAGAVSGGTIAYHGSNKYTPQESPFDFTAFVATTTQAPTTTTQAPTTTTLAPTTTTLAPTTTTAQASSSSSSSGSQSTSSVAMTSTTMTTQNSTTKTMMSSTTKGNSTTNAMIRTTAPPQTTIDLSGCNKTKGCFKIPSGCNSSDACTFVATWQVDASKSNVMFEIKGSGSSWVAFGLNEQAGKMPGTYGEMCYMAGSTGVIKGYHAPRKSTPTFTSSKPNGVTLHSIAKPNGGFICRYTRSFAKTDGTLSININKALYIVLAAGDAVNGGTPAYHGNKRGFSSAKFEVSRKWGGSPGSNANKQSVSIPAFVILGILQMMLLTFVF